MTKDQIYVGMKIKVGDFEKFFGTNVEFSTYPFEGRIEEILDDKYVIASIPDKLKYGKPPWCKIPIIQLEEIAKLPRRWNSKIEFIQKVL